MAVLWENMAEPCSFGPQRPPPFPIGQYSWKALLLCVSCCNFCADLVAVIIIGKYLAAMPAWNPVLQHLMGQLSVQALLLAGMPGSS